MSASRMVAIGVPLLGLLAWPIKAEASGNSKACTALGAACICDEPLDTQTYANVSGNQWFNPADTTTKECLAEGIAAIQSGSGLQLTPVNSGEDWNALPAGHSVAWVARANTVTGMFIGGRAPPGTPTARRQIQFYKYFSSTYNSQNTTGGSCNGNKIAQFGRAFYEGPVFTTEGGTWSVYDIVSSWSNKSVDCCVGPGPGNVDDGPSSPDGLRGKWWRFRITTHNAAPGGTGTTFEMKIKNVTDRNSPELSILDTSKTKTMAAGDSWTTDLATDLHVVGANLDTMLINTFRATNGATACAGYASYKNYTYAAWSVDQGQNIPAAVEIEGSGTAPPMPPKAITVQ